MRFSRVANVFAWPRAHVSLGSEDVVVFLSVATSRELGKAVAQFGPMKLNDVCDSRLYENPFHIQGRGRQTRFIFGPLSGVDASLVWHGAQTIIGQKNRKPLHSRAGGFATLFLVLLTIEAR